MSKAKSPCTVAVWAATGAAVGLGIVGSAAAWGEVGRTGGSMEVKPVAQRMAKKDPVEHVDAAKAAALLSARTNIVVLDVRTPREYRSGRIAGATNINFNSDGFGAAVGKLDRERTYLVHCASGGRSLKSLEVLRGLGFKSILHLDGGMSAWEAAGKPVVKDP